MKEFDILIFDKRKNNAEEFTSFKPQIDELGRLYEEYLGYNPWKGKSLSGDLEHQEAVVFIRKPETGLVAFGILGRYESGELALKHSFVKVEERKQHFWKVLAEKRLEIADELPDREIVVYPSRLTLAEPLSRMGFKPHYGTRKIISMTKPLK